MEEEGTEALGESMYLGIYSVVDDEVILGRLTYLGKISQRAYL